jgi:hypothetical protein
MTMFKRPGKDSHLAVMIQVPLQGKAEKAAADPAQP